MADQSPYPGRLIAIDGTRGKDTQAAAAAVIDALGDKRVDCAISRFDASGLFGELAAAHDGAVRSQTQRNRASDRQLSVRTLLLVYAADLAFRLRWEIRPVLEAGGVVIAAPYLDTATALAVAGGLREDWVRELLRFAPQPHLRGRAEERKIDKGWKRRLDRGFAEYSAAMLAASSPTLASKAARREAVAWLGRPRGRRVFRLSDKGVAGLVTALTGSWPAAPRGSRGRPRSAPR